MLEKEHTFFCYNFDFSELAENFMEAYSLLIILYRALCFLATCFHSTHPKIIRFYCSF